MANVDWISFFIASVAIVLVPGPNSLFVAKTAATASLKEGYMASLGIMVGDTCLICLSIFGVSALFLAYPFLFHIIRLIGALYIIFLGFQVLFLNQKKKITAPQKSIVSFRKAVTISLVNPKAIFFFIAFFPLFVKSVHHDIFTTYLSMTIAFLAVSATYLFILSNFSSKISISFQKHRFLKNILHKLCGCIFIGFGLKVAVLK